MTIGELAAHAHQYQRTNFNGRADWDDGACARSHSFIPSGDTGGNQGHTHFVNGEPSVGNLGVSAVDPTDIAASRGDMQITGDPGYNGGITTATSLNINGSPSLSAGSINLNVKYIDVIICERNVSLDP